MFEAIHGSAPDIAGQNIANPSGLLLGAVMMLVHIGRARTAETVHNAWLRTIEDGVHTADIYREGMSRIKAGTDSFADAVIENLGQSPQPLRPVHYGEGGGPMQLPPLKALKPQKKELVGVDIFLNVDNRDPQALGARISALAVEGLTLELISNRGVKVWPEGQPETYCTDHWRLRFKSTGKTPMTHAHIIAQLQSIADAGIDFVKTEQLYTFDGKDGYAAAQGGS
jgi:isocitrate dehydrogenase